MEAISWLYLNNNAFLGLSDNSKIELTPSKFMMHYVKEKKSFETCNFDVKNINMHVIF